MHRQVFSRALISSTKHIELLMYVCCHSAVLRPDVISYFDPTAKGALISNSEGQSYSRTFYSTVLVHHGYDCNNIPKKCGLLSSNELHKK